MLRVCFSCYGSYTTDQVYQWDLNHTIEIKGLTMDYAPTIHFCNKKSETALVVQSELNNGLITAPVPNELLQEPHSIIAYVHTYDENNAKTVEIINIPLIRRPKPDDYQFTGNVDIMNFERLEADIAEFIKTVNDDFDAYTEETDARVQALEVETQKLLDLASDTFTDQTTTTTDSTLLLSAEGGIKINAVRGVSEQASTNGYQLFDASKLATTSAGGATVTNNGDGSFTVSGSGNLTEVFTAYYNCTHEETLALLKTGILNGINYSGTTPGFYCEVISNGGNAYVSNNITQAILDSDNAFLRFGFYGAVGATIKAGTIKPMIYQDGDGTWEKFSGGQPIPNPQFPSEIDSVVVSEIKSVEKNLLPYPYADTTKAMNGISYTDNGDGTITANGTVTGNTNFHFALQMLVEPGTYTYSLNTLPGNTICWGYDTANSKSYAYLTATKLSATFTITEPTYISFYIVCSTVGVSFPNIVFKPQLELGDTATDYEEYKESVITLSEPITLHGIGDSWDEITPSGVVRKFARVEFTGSGEYWDKYNLTDGVYYTTSFQNTKMKYESSLCTHFINKIGAWDSSVEVGHYTDHIANHNKYFRTDFATLDEWKTYLVEQYANGTPVTLVYELAEPITEELSEVDRLALYSLKSFDTVTYISTDSAVEPVIEVEYGTSRVGALALENSNLHIINEILLDSVVLDHISDTDNPHGVTKAQLGLDKVDNTPDSEKRVAYASEAGSVKECTGLSAKATADANGNNIADTYATFTEVGDLINPINEALPFTIVIDDNAKTINFIDR